MVLSRIMNENGDSSCLNALNVQLKINGNVFIKILEIRVN
jgi:hypothetical protein